MEFSRKLGMKIWVNLHFLEVKFHGCKINTAGRVIYLIPMTCMMTDGKCDTASKRATSDKLLEVKVRVCCSDVYRVYYADLHKKGA
jgi:hypothetical protein